jgi:hypothetical protein
MGDFNNAGQFGGGFTGPSSSFVQWGGRSDITAVGTGTWDQMCASTTSHEVLCSGNGFDVNPVTSGSVGTGFMVTAFGTVRIDDPAVWRPGESRTECYVGPLGLMCGGGFDPPIGTPATVVAGGNTQGLPDDPQAGFCFPRPACWLESNGRVTCSSCDSQQPGQQTMRSYFTPGSVVSLGLSSNGDNLCAVYGDGSLWCLGSNASGMLGTGDFSPRTTPVQVQPPGSIQIGCP